MTHMLDKFQKAAIRDFGVRVAIPILHVENAAGDAPAETVDDVGTGTLFEVDDRLFLVTARHVLDDWKFENLVIPVGQERCSLFTMGEAVLAQYDRAIFDVAVIELKVPEIKTLLRAGRTILSRDAVIDCPLDGEFFLVGYPSQTRMKQHSETTGRSLVTDRPLAIFTHRHNGIPKDAIDNDDSNPVYSNVDLFFVHDEVGQHSDGSEREVPKLQGLSGCSIWACVPVPEDQVWTPERALRVVGVQAAYMSGSYIRGKAWHWVAKSIEQLCSKQG